MSANDIRVAGTVPTVRVWIDLTNSPHVLVMRPVIDVLSAEGHEVTVTARDFAQTLELLDRFAVPHTAIGTHGGERLVAKAVGLASRSSALLRWATRQGKGARPRRVARRGNRPFDLALGHGSNDITVTAALLGIPCSTMFDYEYATVQHQVNCRLAGAVVVPDTIPPERLYRYGARGKIRPYEGLKEEYYLADFEPHASVLTELSLTASRPLVVVRTPPELALYHRFSNDLFGELLARLDSAAHLRGVQVVVLARTSAQRERVRALQHLTVPEHAIDAQSLVTYASLMISAGGTMNREAVALGTPVYTTFQGRIGGVDEALIAGGRLRRLTDAGQIDALLDALPATGSTGAQSPRQLPERIRRDPRLLVELLKSPLTSR
jgi:predicted glycosyltransferase